MIETLAPAVVWQQFNRMTRIPRPSGHETQVRNFLSAFGRSRDLDTFGPTIHFPHSPDERVEISSAGHFWELLVGVLAKV